MLYFSMKPDRVFSKVVKDALVEVTAELSKDDGEVMPEWVFEEELIESFGGDIEGVRAIVYECRAL